MRIARDMIRRVRRADPRDQRALRSSSPAWCATVAPQLLAEKGIGVLIAAKLIGEIAGIDRFTTTRNSPAWPAARRSRSPPDAPTATASIPAATASSTTPSTCSRSPASATTPRPPVYIAKQRANGKTNPEAIRCLKRHLVRRVYHLLRDPTAVPTTVCLT